MLFKKELLISKIGNIKNCTIVGVPTKEVQEVYFGGGDILSLFDKYNIEYKLNIFEASTVSMYFPNFLRKQMTETCMITIENPNIGQITAIENLFTDIREYYQVSIHPDILNKMVGLHSEPLTFATMLMLIPEKSQSKIAEKVGKSKQTIGDIKSGKSKLTLEVLSRLMNLYPLLPWVEFIEQYEMD